VRLHDLKESLQAVQQPVEHGKQSCVSGVHPAQFVR
jgi:hypothetical protein